MDTYSLSPSTSRERRRWMRLTALFAAKVIHLASAAEVGELTALYAAKVIHLPERTGNAMAAVVAFFPTYAGPDWERLKVLTAGDGGHIVVIQPYQFAARAATSRARHSRGGDGYHELR
jgi:hypothetical protein